MSTIPVTFLKAYRPDTFDGSLRDSRAEDWLTRFLRYCNAAEISEDGQERITCAGLLFTGNASRWFDQLGTIEGMTLLGVDHSPYETFLFRFRQRFINANDAEDAFDQIRELRQKRSVNEYVMQFEKIRSRIDNFDDRDAVRFFRGGLKPEIRQLVDNHPEISVHDINGIIALAERLDKMKYPRSFSRPYHPPTAIESYPQPMELDAAYVDSRYPRPSSRDANRKADLAGGLCFYCHKPGHMIGACPMRNKRSSNSRAH